MIEHNLPTITAPKTRRNRLLAILSGCTWIILASGCTATNTTAPSPESRAAKQPELSSELTDETGSESSPESWKHQIDIQENANERLWESAQGQYLNLLSCKTLWRELGSNSRSAEWILEAPPKNFDRYGTVDIPSTPETLNQLLSGLRQQGEVLKAYNSKAQSIEKECMTSLNAERKLKSLPPITNKIPEGYFLENGTWIEKKTNPLPNGMQR